MPTSIHHLISMSMDYPCQVQTAKTYDYILLGNGLFYHSVSTVLHHVAPYIGNARQGIRVMNRIPRGEMWEMRGRSFMCHACERLFDIDELLVGLTSLLCPSCFKTMPAVVTPYALQVLEIDTQLSEPLMLDPKTIPPMILWVLEETNPIEGSCGDDKSHLCLEEWEWGTGLFGLTLAQVMALVVNPHYGNPDWLETPVGERYMRMHQWPAPISFPDSCWTRTPMFRGFETYVVSYKGTLSDSSGSTFWSENGNKLVHAKNQYRNHLLVLYPTPEMMNGRGSSISAPCEGWQTFINAPTLYSAASAIRTATYREAFEDCSEFCEEGFPRTAYDLIPTDDEMLSYLKNLMINQDLEPPWVINQILRTFATIDRSNPFLSRSEALRYILNAIGVTPAEVGKYIVPDPDWANYPLHDRVYKCSVCGFAGRLESFVLTTHDEAFCIECPLEHARGLMVGIYEAYLNITRECLYVAVHNEELRHGHIPRGRMLGDLAVYMVSAGFITTDGTFIGAPNFNGRPMNLYYLIKHRDDNLTFLEEGATHRIECNICGRIYPASPIVQAKVWVNDTLNLTCPACGVIDGYTALSVTPSMRRLLGLEPRPINSLIGGDYQCCYPWLPRPIYDEEVQDRRWRFVQNLNIAPNVFQLICDEVRQKGSQQCSITEVGNTLLPRPFFTDIDETPIVRPRSIEVTSATGYSLTVALSYMLSGVRNVGIDISSSACVCGRCGASFYLNDAIFIANFAPYNSSDQIGFACPRCTTLKKGPKGNEVMVSGFAPMLRQRCPGCSNSFTRGTFRFLIVERGFENCLPITLPAGLTLVCSDCMAVYSDRRYSFESSRRATIHRGAQPNAVPVGEVPTYGDPEIHSYDYKKHSMYFYDVAGALEVAHYGQNPKGDKLYMGIELEVERKSADLYIGDAVADLAPKVPFVYFKRDGSLDEGVEIVFYPATFDWLVAFKNRLAPIFDLSLLGMRSFNTDTCGLHIHMSISAITPLHLAKMLTFMYAPVNASFISWMAQRAGSNLTRWASLCRTGKIVRQAREMSNGENGKYQALNVVNRRGQRTAELRIFRGTLNPNGFYKDVEFCHALWWFTKSRCMKHMDSLQMIAFILNHSSIYPNLSSFIGRRYALTSDLVEKPVRPKKNPRYNKKKAERRNRNVPNNSATQ